MIYQGKRGSVQTIYVNDSIVAEVGSASPVAGETYAILNKERVSINDNGEYVFTASISGPPNQRGVLVKNGALFRRERSTLPSISPYLFASLGADPAVEITRGGDVVHFAIWTGPGATDRGILFNESLIVQIGATQVEGVGLSLLQDSGTLIDVSPNGRFVIFHGMLDDGDEVACLMDLGRAEALGDCGGNRATLRRQSGFPLVGGNVTLAMDDGQGFGVTPFLLVSDNTIPGYPPCGLNIGFGELVIDFSTTNPMLTLIGTPWGGNEVPIDVPIANDPVLSGRLFYAQGIFVDLGNQIPGPPAFTMTNALELENRHPLNAGRWRTRTRRDRISVGSARVSTSQAESVQGVVERITYHDPDSHYTVLRLSPERGYGDPDAFLALSGGRVTAVGRLQEVAVGQRLRLRGGWMTHASHGRQFQIEACEPLPPLDRAGLVRYLSSSLFPGVGEKTAGRIVEHLGSNALVRIRDEDGALEDIPGLRAPVAESVVSTVRAGMHAQELMAFLLGAGLGPAQSETVLKKLGPEAEAELRRDPYRLARGVAGIGFQTADRVAGKLGFEPNSPERRRAALLHVLEKRAGDGHTLLPRTRLLQETLELLAEDAPEPSAMEEALEALRAAQAVKIETGLRQRRARRGLRLSALATHLRDTALAQPARPGHERPRRVP